MLMGMANQGGHGSKPWWCQFWSSSSGIAEDAYMTVFTPGANADTYMTIASGREDDGGYLTVEQVQDLLVNDEGVLKAE